MSDHRLVYSTEKGRICPECGKPERSCVCGKRKKPRPDAAGTGDGTVRVQCDRKGRGGKTATLVTGLPLEEPELSRLAKSLKQLCGSGGSVKDGVLLIQGDHRQAILDVLRKQGFTVKISGG